MLTRKWFVFLLVIPLVFTIWFPEMALAEPENAEEKLKEIQKEKEKKKEEVDKVESNLDSSKEELEDLEKEIDELDQKIEQNSKQLAASQENLNQQTEQVHQMIRRLYVQGDSRYMLKIFQAKSFSDFLYRYDTIRTIVRRETKLLTRFEETKVKIEAAQASIEKTREEQEPLLAEAQKKYEEMKKAFNAENKELKNLEEQESIAKKDVEEMQRLARQASQQDNSGPNLGSGVLGFPSTRGMVYWNYGQNRGSHMHAGIDIPRPVGTPIFSSDAGVVSLSKSNPGGYGHYIVVNHGNGLSTLYAHMYLSSVRVSVGQRVTKGQRIADVGNNGRSSGPHLHFEVWKNGTPVNPRQYIN